MRRHVFSTRTAPIYRQHLARDVGESEARVILPQPDVTLPWHSKPAIYPMLLDKTTGVNADFDGDPFGGWGRSKAVEHLSHRANLLGDEEYAARREQLLLSHMPTFVVEHDWVKALSQAAPDLTDDEVVLPFDSVNFYFPNLDKPLHGNVSEAKGKTAEFSPFTVRMPEDTDPDTVSLFMKQVRYALLALELGLVGQVKGELFDLNLPNTVDRFRGDIYKVLPLRVARSESDTPGESAGYHLRFHLRRSHYRTINGVRKRIKWYAAGRIELGIIIKDYHFED